MRTAISLSLPLLILFISTLAYAQVMFVNGQNFGGNLQHPVAALVNGNIVVSDTIGNSLSYFENDDPITGTLLDRYRNRTKSYFPSPVGMFTQSIVPADLNGDGFDDLVMSSDDLIFPMPAISFSIYDPVTRVFSAETFLTGLTEPFGAVVADVNWDNINDIIVLDVSATPGMVDVVALLQTAPGTFSTPTILFSFQATDPLESRIIATDLNLNGRNDFVVGRVLGNSFTLFSLTATASLTYTTAQIQNLTGTGFVSFGMAMGDLNNSALPDIVYVLSDANQYTIGSLLNFGLVWTPQPIAPTQIAPHIARRIYLGDVQSDGLLDVFMASRSEAIQVHIQTTVGLFADQTTALLSGISPLQPIGAFFDDSVPLILGDLNDDSTLDILLPSDRGRLLAGIPGGFEERTFAHGFDQTQVNTSTSTCVADLNSDGFIDLLSLRGDEVFFSAGDGTGDFRAAQLAFTLAVFPAQRFNSCVTLDYDFDGDADIFLSSRNVLAFGGRLTVLDNDGSALFTQNSTILPTGNIPNIDVRKGDINGDGVEDLFFTGLAAGALPAVDLAFIRIFSPQFGFQQITLAGINGLQGPNFVDFDGDGDLDIVGVPGPASNLSIYVSDGATPIPNFSAITLPPVNISQVVAEDFDNDGDIDFIVFPDGAPAFQMQNQGIGTFLTQTAYTFTGASQSHLVFDFNGDGFLDILTRVITGVFQGDIALLLNDQLGGFTVQLDIVDGLDHDFTGINKMHLTDVDMDTDLDIVTLGSLVGNNKPKILLNTERQFFTSEYASVTSSVPTLNYEFRTLLPGAIAAVFVSLDPLLNPGVPSPFGLARLSNFVPGATVNVASGSRPTYLTVPLPVSPSFIGQRMTFQSIFLDSLGGAQLSNAQSSLLTF